MFQTKGQQATGILLSAGRGRGFFGVVSCLKSWKSLLTYTQQTDILLPSTQTLPAKASTKAGEAIHLKRAGGGGRERERKKIGFCSGRIFKLKHLTTKAVAINFKNPGRLFTPSCLRLTPHCFIEREDCSVMGSHLELVWSWGALTGLQWGFLLDQLLCGYRPTA